MLAGTRTVEVICDANVALKWFRSEGEEEVGPARALLDAHRSRKIAIFVLDLTAYEIGNALLRGRARATPLQIATVLEALTEICPALSPELAQLNRAAAIADQHNLTLYDAAYAALAEARQATLATLDRQLLAAGLGQRPSEIVANLR